MLDFHGQRTSFISGLARAGITPAMAQKLARHSDVNLTMQAYTKLALDELSDAVQRLPNLRQVKPEAAPSEQSAENSPKDAALNRIVAAWPKLPPNIQQIILAIIEAQSGTSVS